MEAAYHMRDNGAWGYRDSGIDLVHFIRDDGHPEKFGLRVLEMVAAGKELEAIIPEECVVDFPGDSFLCDYAYILNLDTAELEYYRGRNTDPDAPGRYTARLGQSQPPLSGVGYYGVRLVKTIPFSVIRETTPEKRSELLRE